MSSVIEEGKGNHHHKFLIIGEDVVVVWTEPLFWRPSFFQLNYEKYYIILFIADVFEEGTIPDCIILIFLATYYSSRIFYHFVVYVQFVYEEINIHQKTKSKRQPSFQRASIEVYPFKKSSDRNVQYRYFVNFMHKREKLAHMLLE